MKTCEYISTKLQNTYIDRFCDAEAPNDAKQSTNFVHHSAVSCCNSCRISVRFESVSRLQAPSNGSRLMGAFPYHLRKSPGVLARLDFATKSSLLLPICSAISVQKQKNNAPWAWAKKRKKKRESFCVKLLCLVNFVYQIHKCFQAFSTTHLPFKRNGYKATTSHSTHHSLVNPE